MVWERWRWGKENVVVKKKTCIQEYSDAFMHINIKYCSKYDWILTLKGMCCACKPSEWLV